METKKTDANPPLRVEIAGDVIQQIRQHARSSMENEICGVLIGRSEGGVTHVTARIAGEGASQGGAHVTFTQDTWEHIFKIKDKEFPDLLIVGWYHSHPGFGIFLSDYDLFIHENFFQAAHQIAWVYDPHSDEEGCFGWADKKVLPLKQVSVLFDPEPPAKEQLERETASHKGLVDPAKAKQPAASDPAREDNSSLLRYSLLVLYLLIAFLVGAVAQLVFGPKIVLMPRQESPLPSFIIGPSGPVNPGPPQPQQPPPQNTAPNP